jgi:very-short-patch-repair endonuclease
MVVDEQDRPEGGVAAMAAIASAQHGVVSRAQVRHCGVQRWEIERLVGSGQWHASTRSVLRCTAAPRTAEQEAMAALLDLGPASSLCRHTALAVVGVDSVDLLPVHASVPRRGRSRLVDPVRIHTSHHLDDEHTAVVRSLRVTVPAMTLIDCAATFHPARLEHVVDRLWALGLLDPTAAEALTWSVGRGHRNIRRLRDLLAVRADGGPPPESGTEAGFHKLLRDDAQPPMRRQVVLGKTGPIGRCDAVDDEAALVVEVQSEHYHGSVSDRRRDRLRREALEADGWLVVEVWEREIWQDGRSVARRLRALRAARRKVPGSLLTR